MGHSPLSASDALTFSPVRARFAMAEREQEPVRNVPHCMDDAGRLSYLAIAKRAQTERVNLYCTLVFGAEMYRMSRKLKRP